MIKRAKGVELPQEPVGIIISRGDTSEPPPKFLAYVWGPAPEPEAETSTATKAA